MAPKYQGGCLITYQTLNSVTEKDAEHIGDLVNVLSTHAPRPSVEQITRVAETNIVIVAIDNDPNPRTIVGMVTLVVIDQLVGKRGRVEDVAVLPSYEGRGIGRGLMERLHARARESGIAKLALTSAPRREAANALYVKLGYKKYETNVYQLYLA